MSTDDAVVQNQPRVAGTVALFASFAGVGSILVWPFVSLFLSVAALVILAIATVEVTVRRVVIVVSTVAILGVVFYIVAAVPVTSIWFSSVTSV